MTGRIRECVKCSTEFSAKDCPVCAKARNAAWCKANAETLKKKRADYYKAHKDIMIKQTTAYHRANAEQLKKYHAEWIKENPSKQNAVGAKRRAYRIKATPKWASDFIMNEAYDLATVRSKATGIKWHVDHIVPLTSDIVCGLHCEFNLRVITGRENIAKGNKHWPDMP